MTERSQLADVRVIPWLHGDEVGFVLAVTTTSGHRVLWAPNRTPWPTVPSNEETVAAVWDVVRAIRFGEDANDVCNAIGGTA